jgi:hypothetical protein
MMPSASDVQAWPVLIAGLALIGTATLVLGGAPALAAFAPLALGALRWLTATFLLTAFINLLAVLAMGLVAGVVGALTGRRVEFR